MKSQAKKFGIFTVGCKLNQYETQTMAESLQRQGFERVDFTEPADLYLINTCTVTAQSDYSSRQAIYRAHRRSAEARILVTGCYAQLQSALLSGLDGVSLVVGNQHKKNISQIATALLDGQKVTLSPSRWEGFELTASNHFKHTRGLVKIQDGCNERCSYCVVPQARGRERSRKVESIISEIEDLVENGFKEVVLTGVHIGKYQKDGVNLLQLTRRILERTKIQRIRFSSIQPEEFSVELIDLLKTEPRICRHGHIPLQSGDDRILQAMNRNYSTAYYRELVESLMKKVRGLCMGADVIVGFPGEKEKEFENTCKFVQSIPLSYLHVFSYSHRPGTAASALPEKIDPKIICERSRILHQIAKEKWQRFLDRFVGQRLEILVEKRRDKKTGQLIGLSDNYLRVLFDGDDSLVNRILNVSVFKTEGRFLRGSQKLRRVRH